MQTEDLHEFVMDEIIRSEPKSVHPVNSFEVSNVKNTVLLFLNFVNKCTLILPFVNNICV